MNGIFPEWLNANSGRAFPLAENCSRTDLTGTVVLPDSLIVAAQICMLPDYAAGTFFVSSVVAAPDQVAVEVSFHDPSDSTSRVIATMAVPLEGFGGNQTFSFVGQGQDSSILGSLTLGTLQETIETIPGPVWFDYSSTPFEVSALFVSTPAVKSVDIYNGATLLASFGDVLMLRAGENIQLSRVDGAPNTIRIDAVVGANMQEPSACNNGNSLPVPPPIRTINGLPGDAGGNFDLDGGTCIDIETSVGLIKLTDLCSQSCCGCVELEALMTGLAAVEQQIAVFQSQMANVVAQQTQMIANLAANIH